MGEDVTARQARRPRAGVGLVVLGLVAVALPGGKAVGGDDGVRLCQGERASIIGTPGADDLRGTKGRDVVVTGGGDDRIAAGKGGDLVCTGKGDDVTQGGSESDLVLGEAGEDSLIGNLASDVLRGGTGPDFVHGLRGSDRCKGGAPNPDGKEDGDKATGCESLTGANRRGSFRTKASHVLDRT